MARKMTLDRVGELMQAMLAELKLAGGTARLKELFGRVEPKLLLVKLYFLAATEEE